MILRFAIAASSMFVHSLCTAPSLYASPTDWTPPAEQLRLGNRIFSTKLTEKQLEAGLTYFHIDAAEAGADKQAAATKPVRQKIHIIALNTNSFTGDINVVKAHNAEAGAELISSMANNQSAIAAMNGGFFVERETDGITGEAAGISIVDGKLFSEATRNRPALLLLNSEGRKQPLILQNYDNVIKITGKTWSGYATGINRKAGIARNCGLTAGPDQGAPLHDVTCKSLNDIILFTQDIGGQPEQYCSDNYKLLNEKNLFSDTYYTALCIPAHMTERVEAGGIPLKVDITYTTSGTPVRFEEKDEIDVVNGGPLLVENGQITASYKHEGWPLDAATQAQHPNVNFNRWIHGPHPRSGVGITATGTILLVAIEGRQPGHSDGLSIPDFSLLFAKLNAVNAINLDGGGSTGMVIDGTLVTTPSDSTGERAVGDAILITSARQKQ